MFDQKIKTYLLENQNSKDQNQIFRKKGSQKWQNVFILVKVFIRITLVHQNCRKIVFTEFIRFFIFVFLICQNSLSTYVDSRKNTDVVVFLSFSFIGILRLANTLKNAIQ